MKQLRIWTPSMTTFVSWIALSQASTSPQLMDTSLVPLEADAVLRAHVHSDSNLYESDVEESDLTLALNDQESRISDDFSIPEPLQPSVKFWLKIYTVYSSFDVVLFDALHPEVIYEVLDFRSLAQRSKSPAAYEIARKKLVQKKISAYRSALLQLSRKRPKPSPELNTVQRAIEWSAHQHPSALWARGLRAQTGQRDAVIRGLALADPYLPLLERIFEDFRVPTELTRLSLVESSFNPRAVSRVGAKGVWQFMHLSALEYLRIDEAHRLDERISPIKATIAAARLLARNYRILGNWSLAAIAYHSGFRGLWKVPRNVRAQGSLAPGLFSSCSKKPHLGWAGRNYYSEFLALLHAEAYRELFYRAPIEPSLPSIRFVKMDGKKTATQLALTSGASLTLFQTLNPEVRNLRVPLPRGYRVILPAPQDTAEYTPAPRANPELPIPNLDRGLSPSRQIPKG